MPVEMVVKLGGSHARSPLLAGWLRAIAAAAGRVVLVPGGGPFGDAVRTLQPELGFDDRTAHAMALLAMAQFGVLLAATPKFRLADTFAGVNDALDAGCVPVWSPWPMLHGAPGIPESWDVTSDSLGLWLATRLGAPYFVLVKHAPLGTPGLLDAAFPHFRAMFAGRIWVAGPDDLPEALDPGAPPGARLMA